MHHRQLLVNQPQLPGLMQNAPGAANMYKLLQQQQQQGGRLNGEQGLPFGASDLDIASITLAQQLQAVQQQQQRQAQANQAANNNMNQQALLALMQANPALAQQLGFGQAAGRGNDAGLNPAGVAAAAAAAAAQAAQQQARVQQAALAAGLLRGGNAQNQAGRQGLGANNNGNRMPVQQGGAGMQGNNAVQNANQFAALQRAAAAQVQQMLQQHQQNNAAAVTAANQQAQLIQAAAALAAQQQQQQNAQKQAQQMQAQQMLKAVLERNNHAAVQQQQHQQAGAMGQGAPINTAALMKQLQLHDAMAKQDALARAAQQQPAQQAQDNMGPALAQLLLRQQQAQQQDMAARNAGAAAGANRGGAGLTQAQLQQLASTPAGQQLLRAVQNNVALDRMAQQQQQQQVNQANGARNNAMLNAMNGAGNMGAAAANAGTMDALLAAQSVMANARPGGNGAANGAGGAGLGGADAPLGGVNGNKEQRRLALACVALQLARSGVSVEQAIQSGIMGGMSVMDVRFIVECYNAERERMTAASGTSSVFNGPGAGNTRANTTSVQSSRTHSPATSVAGSHMSIFGMPAQQPGNGAAPAQPQAQQARFASHGAPDHSNGHVTVPRNGYSEHGSPRSRASANSNGSANGAALDAAAAAAAASFNAFNYGFFGSTGGGRPGSTKEEPEATGALGSGELLGELEPEDGTVRSSSAGDLAGGVTEEQLAWLQSTANAHRARWEGAIVDDEDGGLGGADWNNNDEIAARLANLDLGSGFM